MLVDFLGDVQIVTEFRDRYQQILDIFNKQLATVHQQYPDAEIYFAPAIAGGAQGAGGAL